MVPVEISYRNTVDDIRIARKAYSIVGWESQSIWWLLVGWTLGILAMFTMFQLWDAFAGAAFAAIIAAVILGYVIVKYRRLATANSLGKERHFRFYERYFGAESSEAQVQFCWSEVDRIDELKTHCALCGDFSVIVLPNRVLDDELIGRLRKLHTASQGLGPTGVPLHRETLSRTKRDEIVHWTVNLEDIGKSLSESFVPFDQRVSNNQRPMRFRTWRLVYLVLNPLAILPVIWGFGTADAHLIGVATLLMTCTSIYRLWLLWFHQRLRGQLKTHAEAFGDSCCFCVLPEGFGRGNEVSFSITKWSDVKRVVQSVNFIGAMTRNDARHLIPKHAFESESDWRDFLERMSMRFVAFHETAEPTHELAPIDVGNPYQSPHEK